MQNFGYLKCFPAPKAPEIFIKPKPHDWSICLTKISWMIQTPTTQLVPIGGVVDERMTKVGGGVRITWKGNNWGPKHHARRVEGHT